MEEIIKHIGDFGVSLVICGLFLWDWIANRKANRESLKTISKAMDTAQGCLGEIKEANVNMAKSLNILQTSVDTTSNKLDILLDRHVTILDNRKKK